MRPCPTIIVFVPLREPFFGEWGSGMGHLIFAWDNNNNNKNNNNNNKNPHLNFLKGTVLGDKEQGVGIRDNG